MDSITLKELLSLEKLSEIAAHLSSLSCCSDCLTVEIKLPSSEMMRKFNDEVRYKYLKMENLEDDGIIPDEINLNILQVHFRFVKNDVGAE